MAVIEIATADTVKTLLDGEVFSLPFTPVRRWAPVFDVKALDTLKVTVIAQNVDTENQNRKQTKHLIDVAVVVQKLLSTADTADGDTPEIDQLAELSREIRDFLNHQALTSPAVSFVRISHKPLVDPQMLFSLRVYTSLLTITYHTVL